MKTLHNSARLTDRQCEVLDKCLQLYQCLHCWWVNGGLLGCGFVTQLLIK